MNEAAHLSETERASRVVEATREVDLLPKELRLHEQMAQVETAPIGSPMKVLTEERFA